MKKIIFSALLALSISAFSQKTVQIGITSGNVFTWEDGYTGLWNYGGEIRYIANKTEEDRTEFTFSVLGSSVDAPDVVIKNTQIALGLSRFHNFSNSTDFQHGPTAGIGVAKNFGSDNLVSRSSWDIQPMLGYQTEWNKFYLRVQAVQGLGTLVGNNTISQTDILFTAGISL